MLMFVASSSKVSSDTDGCLAVSELMLVVIALSLQAVVSVVSFVCFSECGRTRVCFRASPLLTGLSQLGHLLDPAPRP